MKDKIEQVIDKLVTAQVVEDEEVAVPAKKRKMPPIEELEKQFDPKGLEDEITKRLGFKPKGLKIELKAYDYGHTSGVGILVTSDNLIGKCGIMNQVFSEVSIKTHNYSTKVESNGQIVSWAAIDMYWQHIDRGTNGGDWFSAFYTFDTGKWTFRG